MEEQEEKGLAELFTELHQRVQKLEEEVTYLRSQYYGTLRASDTEGWAAKVEQSIARRIRMQVGKRI